MIPAWIPEWVLKLILGYAVKWLYKKVGLDATVCHVEAAVAKVSPLVPEENPPLSVSKDPNQSHDAAHGGWRS